MWRSAMPDSLNYRVRASWTALWGRVGESWNALTMDDQRTVIRAVVDRIIIKPSAKLGFNRFDSSRVEVEWRIRNLARARRGSAPGSSRRGQGRPARLLRQRWW